MKTETRGRPQANENEKKVPVQAMILPELAERIQEIAASESRSVSNTIAFLLESHPKLNEVAANV